MNLSLVLRNLQIFQLSTSVRTQQAALISLPVMGKLRELYKRLNSFQRMPRVHLPLYCLTKSPHSPGVGDHHQNY